MALWLYVCIYRRNIGNKRSQHSQECKDSRQRCFCDSWPWPLTVWPQNTWVSKTHLYMNISFSSLVTVTRHRGFWDVVRKKKQTDTQTNGGKNRTPRLPTAWVKMRNNSNSGKKLGGSNFRPFPKWPLCVRRKIYKCGEGSCLAMPFYRVLHNIVGTWAPNMRGLFG